MCYSTDDLADPKSEVTYDENYPYGTDGYRTDCNNVQVIKRRLRCKSLILRNNDVWQILAYVFVIFQAP